MIIAPNQQQPRVDRIARATAWAVAMATLVTATPGSAEPASWSTCDMGDIRIETNFPGARASACYRQAKERVAVLVLPEDKDVNPSAWFAFRITSDRPRRIAATLVYGERKHRYWPKVSVDGRTWERLPPRSVTVAEDGRSATLRLDVGAAPIWVAAQEVWDGERHDDWLRSMSGRGGATITTLGWSAQRRPIRALQSAAPQADAGTIVLVGRQHPPEVPGAFAFERFVETLLDDSELSRRFRSAYAIVAVPNLNPDGVALGNWRENAGGMDINRDWGPFTQPETRLMRDLLAALAADATRRPRIFLDFHATREDVFYTQRDEDPVEPPLFERHWLGCLQQRMPGYEVNRKPGHNPDFSTAKTWVYKAYGIPSVTFELGDETPRELIGTLAGQAAVAMMEVLLAEDPQSVTAGGCSPPNGLPKPVTTQE